MLDTGADVSCIDSKFLQNVLPGFEKWLQPAKQTKFQTADETTMNCKGILPLTFFIGTKSCVTNVFVFSGLTKPLILGRPFFKKYKAKFDFGSGMFTLNDQLNVKSVNEIKIPGNTTVEVYGECLEADKMDGMKGLNVIVKPSQSLTRNCLGFSTLFSIGKGYIPMVLKNKTPATITIPRGITIGHISPVFESEIQVTTTLDNDDVSDTDDDVMTFNINESSSTKSQTEKLKDMLKRNKDAFVDKSGKLGHCDIVEHDITLKPGAVPCSKMPYRVAPHVKQAVQEQIDNLLGQGVIEETSSPWSSPLVVVKKGVKKSRKHMPLPDNVYDDVRIVIDYRYLNSVTLNPCILIPRLPDLVDSIGAKSPKIYSVLDLKSGYFQQNLTERSRDYTSFCWNNSQFRFTRTPQGLSGSPISFQRLMNKVLQPYLDKFAVCYLDDIMCYSSSYEEHIEHLDTILKALTAANLKLHPNKCTFAATSCEFLGHTFSHNGITPSESHVDAIKTYPPPTNVKELRTFIGLICFFRDFIPQRAQLMSPLNELTRKNVPFNWTERQQKSFDKLKEILTSDSVLAYPNFEKDFVLITDASKTGIGGLLAQTDEITQKLRPVAFCGRATNERERRLLPATALECLAAVYCCSRFNTYLSGKPFTLITDCSALKSILGDSSKLSPKMQRWSLMLSQYTYNVEYRKGVLNTAADALSRRPYSYCKTKVDDTMDEFPLIASIVKQKRTKRVQKRNPPASVRIEPVTESSSNKCPLTIDNETNTVMDNIEEILHTATDLLKLQTTDYTDACANTVIKPLSTRPLNDAQTVTAVNNPKRSDMPYNVQAVTRAQRHQAKNNDSDDIPTEPTRKTNKSKMKQARPTSRPKRKTVNNDHIQNKIPQIWQNDISELFTKDNVRKEQENDEFCHDLVMYLEDDILPPTVKRERLCILREHDFVVEDGLLYQIWQPIPSNKFEFHLRLVIPKTLQTLLIKWAHESAVGAHVGVTKMTSIIRSRFCFTGQYDKIKTFVISCEACQKSKHSTKLQTHRRTLYEITTQPFERVSLDFLGPFDRSARGNRWICNVTDSYSSYIIAFPMRDITAKTLAHALHDKVFSIYGCPKQIVTDRGPQLTSDLFKTLLKLFSVQASFTTPYHPQANGLSERSNRSITSCLRALVHDRRHLWDVYLPSCVFALNNTVCSTNTLTPYNLIFGRDACNAMDTLLITNDTCRRTDVIADIIDKQEQARKTAVTLHEKRDQDVKNRQIDYKDTQVCAGSIVYWKVPRIDSIHLGSKLSYLYRGPYIVCEVHPGQTVSIRHLHTAKMHGSRVSISQLKVPAYFNNDDEIATPNTMATNVTRRLRQKGAKFSTIKPGDSENY